MISRQIEVLLSAYRRDDYADCMGFVTQLGSVLEGYPASVILAVTSPKTGLQRRCKWPPTVAEVVEACDNEAAAQERVRERERVARMQPVPRLPCESMESRLCRRFGIRAVPRGYDAIDITRLAHEHGSGLQVYLDGHV